MPSPVKKFRGKHIYKRKGGSIRGRYSIHKVGLDRQQKARKNRKLRERYPQAYD